MSLHNILLHQNPGKHSSHKMTCHKITLQWCNSFPNATLSLTQTTGKLLAKSSAPQGAQISIHREVLPLDLPNSEAVCSFWMAHLFQKRYIYVPMLCMCCTVTGTHHHYSLWALHLETVSAASGSQRSPDCQRNHLCRGEAGRGNHCVQSPSSLYSRCHECCAWGSQYPLFPTWKYSRNLFIKKALTHSWDALHTKNKASSQIPKISSPKKGFLGFCPFFPPKQSASSQ